jgi:5-methylcytosine-specific restriction protein A
MPQSIKTLGPRIPAIRPSTNTHYGYQHRQWRRYVLMRNPICQSCHQARSVDLDHILPISKGGAAFDINNAQGLCRSCHSAKTWKEQHP